VTNTLRLRDKTASNLYNDTGTIQHIALYEQSLTTAGRDTQKPRAVG